MSEYKQVGSYAALRARAGDLRVTGTAPLGPRTSDEKITPAMKKAYAEKLAREEYGKSYSQLTPAEKREIDGYVAEEVFRTGDADISHLFQNGKCVQCGCGLTSKEAEQKCPNAKEPYK